MSLTLVALFTTVDDDPVLLLLRALGEDSRLLRTLVACDTLQLLAQDLLLTLADRESRIARILLELSLVQLLLGLRRCR